jgi:hypothetical protein
MTQLLGGEHVQVLRGATKGRQSREASQARRRN